LVLLKKQNKTKQNKTKQNKTKQNKTKQRTKPKQIPKNPDRRDLEFLYPITAKEGDQSFDVWHGVL